MERFMLALYKYYKFVMQRVKKYNTFKYKYCNWQITSFPIMLEQSSLMLFLHFDEITLRARVKYSLEKNRYQLTNWAPIQVLNFKQTVILYIMLFIRAFSSRGRNCCIVAVSEAKRARFWEAEWKCYDLQSSSAHHFTHTHMHTSYTRRTKRIHNDNFLFFYLSVNQREYHLFRPKRVIIEYKIVKFT